MRVLYLIFGFLCSCFCLSAQDVDYDKIILPEGTFTEDIREKLVRIAWRNYPANEIFEREITIADKELVQAKWSWFENVGAQANINEFTINPGVNDRAAFYPKYNFSARVTIGMFADIPAEIRKMREGVEISKAKLNQQKIDLRAEVLTRYQEYLMQEKLLETQIKNSEDAFSSYSLAEQQFKNGQITLEDYNLHLENYNNEQILKIRAETEYQIALISLEQLLGVKLEDVK